MQQILPNPELYANKPCSFVALNCALGVDAPEDLVEMPEGLRERDGYLSLAGMNKYARKHLNVKRRKDYKRGERPKLKELHLDGKAIVVVLGHCVFVDGESYWSFFDNEDDDVVAVWELA